MIRQLVPATANFSDKVATVIESHILERNKYRNKFPNIKLELEPPESSMQGGAAQVNYTDNSAPLGTSPQPENKHCSWWKNRAYGSSSWIAPNIFANREEIVSVSHTSYNREVNSIAVFRGAGIDDPNAGVIELGQTRNAIIFGSDGYLSLSTGSFEEEDCLDDT